MMANARTYEIMTPESVGIKKTSLVLGKHSGQHAFEKRMEELGYTLDADQISSCSPNSRTSRTARRLSPIGIWSLWVESGSAISQGQDTWALDNFVVNSGNLMTSTACVTLRKGEQEVSGGRFGYRARLFGFAGGREDHQASVQLGGLYQLQAVTEHRDAWEKYWSRFPTATGSTVVAG
jgi:2-isopropylmalate synthase